MDKYLAGLPTEEIKSLARLAIVECGTTGEPILKSSTDERDYRYVVLENKLRVMLVRDKHAEISAASLAVNVGSFSDPPDFPGLAHFLEHMLFMGTSKYPDEAEYEEFLTSHAGSSNAWTDDEITNYYFDVENSFFFDALDRFAQFFIEPLFHKSTVERELKSVDNEFSRYMPSDSWRLDQVQRDICKTDHVFHKFGTGNWKSLYDDPKEKGLDVREALIQFFKRTYSANLMSLCVIGNANLDEMEANVREMFSLVPNFNREKLYIHPSGNKTFSQEDANLGLRVFVDPSKDVNNVYIKFLLPPVNAVNRLTDASSFLQTLLGDEGEGSILNYLQDKSYCNELSAYLDIENFDFSLFCVDLECTESGIQAVNEVVEVVFSYINMLRDLDDENLKELCVEETLLSLIGYWFKDPKSPSDYADDLCSLMQTHFPNSSRILSSHVKFGLKDAPFENVRNLLSYLKIENSNIYIVSKKLKESQNLVYDKKEIWYEAKYKTECMGTEELQRYSNTEIWKEVGLQVQKPNKFIPKNFSVREFEQVKTSSFIPRLGKPLLSRGKKVLWPCLKQYELFSAQSKRKLLEADNIAELSSLKALSDKADVFRPPTVHEMPGSTSLLWYKQDTVFGKPKTLYKISLKTGLFLTSMDNYCAMKIFLDMLSDELREETYAAQEVGFYKWMSVDYAGITFNFEGFSDYEPLSFYVSLVLEAYNSYIQELLENFDDYEDSFQSTREKLLKKTQNKRKVSSEKQCYRMFFEITFENEATLSEYEIGYEKVSKESMRNLLESLASEEFEVQHFIAGSTIIEEAVKLALSAEEFFEVGAEIPVRRLATFRIPEGRETVMFKTHADADMKTSGAIAVMEFGAFEFKQYSALKILAATLSERFFNQLRTIEGLAYSVHAWISEYRGTMYMFLWIDSNSADPFVLNRRIDSFLAEFYHVFEKMEAREFESLVSSQIGKLFVKPKKLEKEVDFHFSEIQAERYCFDYYFLIARAMSQVQKVDILEILKERIIPGAEKRSKLFVGLISQSHFRNDTFKEVQPLTLGSTLDVDTVHKILDSDTASFSVLTNLKQLSILSTKNPSRIKIFSRVLKIEDETMDF
eukprot:augustus_masked-scaffold_8-processed-gene-3.15-mRNA-1 protein AED:0.36 eAED:0.36 QI:0/-1/0/1/-1/1/1/0/1096